MIENHTITINLYPIQKMVHRSHKTSPPYIAAEGDSSESAVTVQLQLAVSRKKEMIDSERIELCCVKIKITDFVS